MDTHPPAARVERDVVLRIAQGLHARPAAKLVETAKRFASEVVVANGEVTGSAKDLLDMLYLAATVGSVLRLRAEGPDAHAAVDALEQLLARLAEER